MKRFLFWATTLLAILAFSPVVAANPANWNLQLSTPFSATGNRSSTRSFNIMVSVSSVNASDIMSVKVFQDASLLGTFSENASSNGESWTQPVSVAADGSYTFKAIASNNNGDTDKTLQTVVTVDTVAPGTPAYQGKTRSGNTYTVNITVPSGSDVSTVKIFASTTTSFTANSSSQVGSVNVTPSQQVTFSYTAPDNADRFFAIQAFDATGNGSVLSGDSITTPGGAATTSSAAGARAVTTTTNPAGGSTTTSGTIGGHVESNQSAQKDSSKTSSNQNTETTNSQSGKSKKKINWTVIGITVAILVALYASYRWFMDQAEKE